MVSTLLGVLMFCTWLQSREQRALLYWGAAGLAAAMGLDLQVGDKSLLGVGAGTASTGLYIVACGLTWSGARCFGGLRPRLGWVAFATIAWIAASQTALIAEHLITRIVLMSLLRFGFIALAILELWRGRDERLLSRWPALVTLGIHAAALALRIPVVLLAHLPPEPAIYQTGWFGMNAMGQLMYTTTITFVLLAMTKERAELRQKIAARSDPLTALLNRRAFMEEGEACLAGSGAQPLAALIFDLDLFKSINDRFGHAAGDDVLQRFAATLRGELGCATIGRLGGEEFAALLPGLSLREAAATAERVRASFAAGGWTGADAQTVNATVSVGVAATVAGESESLTELLAAADRAVYLAKRSGRNRVCLAGAGTELREVSSVAPAPHLAA
jgi:diguanylate cyclase (GGDEF)-like protein